MAYENAADAVEHLTREIYDIWQEGRLRQVQGIGDIIADSLSEYFKKGYSHHFREVKKGIPETVFELMKVSSIGPKKAYKLVKALSLTNVKNTYKDLRKKGLQGAIAKIPTFGKKSEEAILTAIDTFLAKGKGQERMPLPYADRLAQDIASYLKKNKDIERIDILGSLRRRTATIGDIDIAVICKRGSEKNVVDYFLRYPKKVIVDNAGEKKASIIVIPHVRIDLRVQEEKTYGSMLQYFTGSKEHNIKLREYALKKNYSLSEYGIKDLRTKKKNLYDFSNEKSFYNFLGLQYISPEIREGGSEIEVARNKELPTLIKLHNIKGDFHTHSDYDLKPSHDLGHSSYEELIKKAEELEHEYIGFSDHNPKQAGLKNEEIVLILKKRKDHIRKTLRKKTNLDYYIGLEVDILPNGNIAFPRDAFPYIDYLIVSVHSVFRMDITSMTQRILRALEYPKVKILGHPTGRLLGKREGCELNWNKVFERCRKKNIALEINSWPERLDLPDSLVYDAKKSGCKFIINSDAHATFHMDNLQYGVSVARRGWLTKHDIINSKSKKIITDWIAARG